MNHKPFTYRFLLKGLLLFAGVAILITPAEFSSAKPTSGFQGAQNTNFNLGFTDTNMIPNLPREETLYFNSLQWGSVVGWNPYSSDMNNSLAILTADNARVTVWETPYLYNMLDHKQYPLLADGPWTWNQDRTVITFKIKTSAYWSDGTPVTSHDVAYTWATNIKYGTAAGVSYQDYIDTIEVVDSKTVRVKAKLDGSDQAINPLMVSAYLSSNYVVQKVWTQTLEARSSYDANALKADPGLDFVASGPYMKHYVDNNLVVLIRDEDYWGQDDSMWGKLPAPKFLAHTIFADNNSALNAFKAGEVDISQAFIGNVQDLWLVEGLPISTYYSDAPYMVPASLPTAYYNLKSYGLDNVTIRKAIAIAADYDAIISKAMTNQSPTFKQVPRSVMSPLAHEQSLYNQVEVASLQWTGNDIEGAKQLLNNAGIVDTNGDGWRELAGQKLTYKAVCPNGWVDWQEAIEIIAEAGSKIGIDIQAYFPDWSEYSTVFTDGTQTEYDIFMVWSNGSGPANPWGRVRQLMSSEFVGLTNNWSGNWGGYVNPRIDEIIAEIPGENNLAQLKDLYTEATEIYLTDIPSFTVMYRPDQFYVVNKKFWTKFPHQGDGTNPPIPPLNLIDGWGIAGLYNITNTKYTFLPLLLKP